MVRLTDIHYVQDVGGGTVRGVRAAKYGPALTGLENANSHQVTARRRGDGELHGIPFHVVRVDPNLIGPQDLAAVFKPDLKGRGSPVLLFRPRGKRKTNVAGRTPFRSPGSGSSLRRRGRAQTRSLRSSRPGAEPPAASMESRRRQAARRRAGIAVCARLENVGWRRCQTRAAGSSLAGHQPMTSEAIRMTKFATCSQR